MMQEENRFGGGNASAPCVKGTSRRIVVVSAQDNPIYESVIYVVRDDAAVKGVSAQDIMQQAQSALRTQSEPDALEPDMDEEAQDAYRVSRILFALSGIVLALSGGVLAYWFIAM